VENTSLHVCVLANEVQCVINLHHRKAALLTHVQNAAYHDS